MYCIQKQEKEWSIKNNLTGSRRFLTPVEVGNILEEFPFLKESINVSYFRNQVSSIDNLP